MFCHYCGKKLVSGARFCSWCSTPVPAEILEEAARASGGPAEAAAAAPEPVKEPVPEPAEAPAPVPVRGPEPEPPKVPPAPVKEPEPPAEPVPESPKTPPSPVKEPEPAAEPEPEPPRLPPAPVKEPEPPKMPPAPVKEPEPDLPEEEILVTLPVTGEQIEKGETVVLRHSALLEPMNLTLRKGMKEMTRLKLTNAKMKPVPGKKPVLVVRIHVKPSAVPPAPPKPATQPATQPVQPPKASPAAQAPARKTVSFAPVTFPCAFQLCPQGSLKTGYRFGGADDEGNIDLSPSCMTVYRKSKMVGAAFGIIGSAIEGKGKQIADVRPQDISSFEKEAKKHNVYEYRIYLKDRQVLKLLAQDSRKVSVISTVDRFLSQV